MAYEDKTVGAESGGDANAKNSRSSATGAGQFIDATWLDMLAKNRPDLTGSRDELLALRADPKLSAEMVTAYGNENAGRLSQAGLPVTDGTKYLAHFAGGAGAVGLLNADPSTPAASILGRGFVKANPRLAGYTAGDLAAWADREMGGGAAPSRSASPMAMAGPAPAAPAAAPAAAGAPMSLAPPPAQPPAAPQLPAASASGSAAPFNLAALAAVPQLQNVALPARPNLLLGRKSPFSLRG